MFKYIYLAGLLLKVTPAHPRELNAPDRKRPRLVLGQWISDAAQTYADAVSIPYLITFGLEPHTPETRERSKRLASSGHSLGERF
jgi:hypothetical protein